MHTDSGMTGISLSGYMPYMTVASLEMSDEPFLPLSHILTNKQDIHLSYSAIRQDYLLVFIWNDNFVD